MLIDLSEDVVRVAPNELVFVTPPGLTDIYGSHVKNLELFPKTQINNHGNDKHGGVIWEWDPVRHREVAKQLSPAFSGRTLKVKEPTLHKYIDLFVERMKSLGSAAEGEPPYLSLLKGFSKAVTAIQVSWRFPFLAPLKYIFLLFTAMRPHAHIRDHSRYQLEQRIRRKGAVEHLDFFEQIVPENREPPRDKRDMRHLEQVAGQLLAAGFEPSLLWLYYTLYYLAAERSVRDTLAKEIRGSFQSYNEITATTAASLPYLTVCLEESLRTMPNLPSGLPVVSPGAMVDGAFIPKGPVARAISANRCTSGQSGGSRRTTPSTTGASRVTIGRASIRSARVLGSARAGEIAWWQSRVSVAKVLWMFDLDMVGGRHVDVDRVDWGIYHKPEVYVRFVLGAHDGEAQP
ncbi:hypothetical protein Hte_008783 [Hypoxylon texense]